MISNKFNKVLLLSCEDYLPQNFGMVQPLGQRSQCCCKDREWMIPRNDGISQGVNLPSNWYSQSLSKSIQQPMLP